MRNFERMQLTTNIFNDNEPVSYYPQFHHQGHSSSQLNTHQIYGSCKYCLKYHLSLEEKCYFVCLYCNGIHLKDNQSNFNKNTMPICPILRESAIAQQNKKAFECDGCGGNGKYQKVVQTAYLQLKQSFQARMRQYQQLKPEEKIDNQPPTRKIYKNKQEIKKEICERCSGTGKIYKMTKCCQNGCPGCQFSGIKLNSKWRQIRTQGLDNIQSFSCKICSQEVKVGDKIFTLHCGHTFHKQCIFSWLYMKEGCFLCSEEDPYLHKSDFPFQSLSQLKYIETMLNNKSQKLKRQRASQGKLAKLSDLQETQNMQAVENPFIQRQRKKHSVEKSYASQLTRYDNKYQTSQYFGLQFQIPEAQSQSSMSQKQSSASECQDMIRQDPRQIEERIAELGIQTHKWWMKMQQLLKSQQKNGQTSHFEEDQQS